MFVVLIFCNISKAQSNFCGTSITSVDPSPTSSNAPAGPFFIKTYLHIIRDDNGGGGLSISEQNSIIPTLNQDFNPHNIFFSLACVNFIDFTTAYNNDFNILQSLIQTSSQYFQNDGLNIYLIPISVSNPANLQGLAAGIIGQSCYVYYGSNDKTLSHEVGHCLGLYHTFHGTCAEAGEWAFADPALSNCLPVACNHGGSGDMVEDTPGDDKFYFGDCQVGTTRSSCGAAGISGCCDPNGLLYYKTDPKNIMAYGGSCAAYFTPGQGARMRDKMPNAIKLSTPSVILQNTTITGVVEMSTDLVIKAPNTLIIDGGTLLMKPGRKIVVEGGKNSTSNAELQVINSGKITRSLINSSAACNDNTKSRILWDGIELGAGENRSGGKFFFNVATIEFARRAIKIAESTATVNRGGGRANKTSFLNNNLSLSIIASAQQSSGQSFRFADCLFQRDNSYVEDIIANTNKPQYSGHINVRLAPGIITMVKCTLKDDHMDKATVLTNFRSFSSPLVIIGKNQLYNGQIGLQLSGINYVDFCNVDDNDFKFQINDAVRCEGYSPYFSKNRFALGAATTGLRLNSTNSFTIKGNTFENGAGGFDITDGSSAPTTILKNIFKNGFANANRFVGSNNGVLLRCNSYENSGNNIVNAGMINSIQGSAALPTGNSFNDGGSNFDFISSSQKISYHYSQNIAAEEPQNILNLAKFSTNSASRCNEINIDMAPVEAETDYVTNKTAYDQLKGNLSALLDAGNSPGLISVLHNANSSNAQSIKSLLIGYSPYLSNDVIQVFMGRIDIYTVGDRVELISANSHILLDQLMLDYLLQGNFAITANMLSTIPIQTTTRLAKEAEINDHFFAWNNAINAAVGILSAEEEVVDFNALRIWYGRMHSFEGAMKIADSYYKELRYNEWLTSVNNIPNQYTLTNDQALQLTDYKNMYNVLINASSQGRNYSALNSAELNSINAIAISGSFHPNTFAKKFLEEFYGYQFGSGSSLKTSGQVPVEESQTLSKFIPNQIYIFPNPASSNLTIQVPEAIVGQTMEINFYDSVGKLVKTNKLTASKENSFSIRDLDEGLYYLQVVAPNLLRVTKLSIIK